jgi:plasmid stability protein
MRTTIRLDDALLRRAKAHAATVGRSLNDFIADAVRAALAPRASPAVAVELPTYRGRGAQPGVDLDDSASLLDLMEAPGASRYPAPGAVERGGRRRVAEKPRKRGG